jgi:hypothetical protein
MFGVSLTQAVPRQLLRCSGRRFHAAGDTNGGGAGCGDGGGEGEGIATRHGNNSDRTCE